MEGAWWYFETGHGKRVCDGMEGLQKRLADMAVKRRQAIIQSAEDFYKLDKDQENSKLKYIFVLHEECVDVQEDLDISL